MRISTGTGPETIELSSLPETGTTAPYDVVWMRRPFGSTANERISKFDRRFVERETDTVLKSALWEWTKRAYSVNPVVARTIANRKPSQLIAARRCGWTIPDTLISNDSSAILRFARAHGERIVYKPLSPISWAKDGVSYVPYTKLLAGVELESHIPQIEACPGIFQPFIDKAYELRVTVMGASVFAAKLETADCVDWRDTYRGMPPLVPYELPQEISDMCVNLLRSLSLRFGCIDLIRDVRGEYVFLEVNEMGQFLWVEVLNKSVPMLDAFCRFLVSRDDAYKYVGASAEALQYSDYLAAGADLRTLRMEKHTRPKLDSIIVFED
ncbi:MAG: hypothetical protein F9K47_13420 [Burkholderiales bacterium]|nr:MAG: hypothetical protein F9K47_13420 [Burkholderiales bacterium]